MKSDDVMLILHEHQKDLVKLYHIATLSVFGSVARNEARADSDVDLFVEFAQPTGLFQLIELQKRLEALLGCKVDLGTLRSLKSGIKAGVLQEAIRIF